MNSNHRLRQIRQIFWRPRFRGTRSPYRQVFESGLRSQNTVRLFYAISFFNCLDYFRVGLTGLEHVLIVHPVWPLFWLDLSDGPLWAVRIFFAHTFFAALAFCFPQLKLARIGAFLGTFFFFAILASDAAGWERMSQPIADYVPISFLLIFLPAESFSTRARHWRTITIIVLAQITLLSSYFSSAICRIRETIGLLAGEAPVSFEQMPLANFVKHYAKFNGRGALGEFLIAHNSFSGPILLLGTLFEISSLYIIFRPQLYRGYGIALLLFHFGFAVVLRLPFYAHIYLVIIFLVASPLGSSLAKTAPRRI